MKGERENQGRSLSGKVERERGTEGEMEREEGDINNTEDVSKSHRETYYFRSLPKIHIRVLLCSPD